MEGGKEREGWEWIFLKKMRRLEREEGGEAETVGSGLGSVLWPHHLTSPGLSFSNWNHNGWPAVF